MIIGIVGKPSSGKSSFFKAATMIDVKISPVPFTTIKPNLGVGHVIVDCPEKEFGVKCNPKHGYCKNGKRFVPVRLVDVAGLVPGAHEGKGMGNQFLDDLRQASALIHVVDASGITDEEENAATNHDPLSDIEFLEKEVDFWFASVIKKVVDKIAKERGKVDILLLLTEQLSGLEISKQHISDALQKAPISDVEKFATALRQISKPVIVAANKIDLKEAQENFEKMKGNDFIIPTSAEAEIALKKAAEKDLIVYLSGGDFEIKGADERQMKALGIIKKEVIDKFGSTGIQACLNKAVFELLNYIVVFPVADSNKLSDRDGNIIPDAFLVPKGTTTKDLAFKIHTDIGKKFVAGIDVRSKRRLAADHELKNNEIVEIMTSK